MGRDIPSLVYGTQTDYKKLYYSEADAALKIGITLQAGYGKIEQGQTLAKNSSAAGSEGKHVPYNATSFDGTSSYDQGRLYLVSDAAIGASTADVTINDSYKVAVGDDLIINDDTTTAENLGAITAIDRTTYATKAVITFTTVVGSTAFETANAAYVCVEAGDSTNNYSDCVGILEKTVDTGTGADAKGAIATLIVSNAVLYKGMLTNADSAALTDISGTNNGQYMILK